MNFHEANPLPTNSSNKRLKIRLQCGTMSFKRNSTSKDSIPLHLPPHKNTIISFEGNSPTPADSVLAKENIHANTKSNFGRITSIRRRSTFDRKGNNDRGGPYGSQYKSTPVSTDWCYTVKLMMSELKLT